MADDKDKDQGGESDLFDEKDVGGTDEGAGDDDNLDADDSADEGMGEGAGGDSEAAKVKEASAEAAELGIIVPDDAESCEEWVEHFITAVKTHKATKGAEGGADMGGGNPEGTESGGAAPAEEPMTTISMSQADQARVATLERELTETKKHLGQTQKVAANALLKDTMARVDAVARSGAVDRAQVEEWKQVLTSKQMSLLSGKDPAIRKVVTELACYERIAKNGGSLLQNRTDMSRTHGEAPPPWYFDEAKEAEKSKEQKEVTDEMITMANGNR